MKKIPHNKLFKNYLEKSRRTYKSIDKFFGNPKVAAISFIFPFFAIVLLSNFDYSIVRLSKFSIYKLNSIDLRLNKKNKSQISKIAEKTTVKIDGINEGSGVIVKRNGNRYTVITAWHVIKDNLPSEELNITTFDGTINNWESMNLKRIQNFDLATLTFKSQEYYQTAKIGDIKKIDIGNTIYIAGFPIKTSSIPLRSLRVVDGEIIGNIQVKTPDGYQLIYNNDTRSGMSGGGIFNEKGYLIGIHGRTERNESDFKFYGKDTSTGINMGVPIKHYKSFINKDVFESQELSAETIVDPLLEAKRLLSVMGEEEQIIKLAQKSLEKGINPEAFAYIAYAKNQTGNSEDALEYISQAIELDSKNSYYFGLSGDIKLSLKEYESAIKDFSKAIKINPNNSDYFYKRGMGKEYLGDYRGSINDLSRAIALDPSNLIYVSERAKKKSSIGDYEGAISDISKTLGYFELEPISLYQRGIIKEKAGDYKDAAKDFSKSLFITNVYNFLAPKSYWLILFRGDIKFKLKDYSGAIEDYRKVIEIDPQNPAYYLALSNALYQLREYESALLEINNIIKLFPDKSSGYFLRGNTKYNLGDYEGALNDLNKAIEIQPDNAKFYRNRSYTNYALQNIQDSCNDYKKSIDLKYKSSESDYPITEISNENNSWCINTSNNKK